ncbi:MAG: D-alanyl-D-alanine carboxypeptidase/D-alanyl-D-alanine-endopeptidase [SAR324 cluster bacterium]|nr:D-alanyl-D-alanine carboxypeptidase/D-alanyl-D-alanine-endopeptidase [SAR324 cluster bacterium]
MMRWHIPQRPHPERSTGRAARRTPWLRTAAPLAATLFGAGLLIGLGGTPRGHAAEPDGLARRIEGLLAQERLDHEGVALVLRSPSQAEPLYALRPAEPRIPASNVKLVVSYVALRELTPNFRWRTRFFLVEEQDDPRLPPRQGLLVEGGGDPTLTRADLDTIALRLRLTGLDRIDGHLFYDDRMFEGPAYPEAWGPIEDEMPWYAPVSPFILNLNTAGFLIVVGGDGTRVDVIPQPPLPEARIFSQFNWIEDGRESIRLRQLPSVNGLAFSVSGDLLPLERTFSVATAIIDPVDHFFRQLRWSLQQAGLGGQLPLSQFSGTTPVAGPVYTHYSRPLGAYLREVNKESNNLVAEVMLRALALRQKEVGITSEDGLAVVNEVVAHDFPEYAEQLRFFDGSGLSRDNRVTAGFIVALLERVLTRFEFRAEYLSSLSVGGWDGTLQNRSFPRRQWGRIRAKSGTLKGVQNLSGYFNFGSDLVVFSFLIQDDPRDYLSLQRAQDRVISGIFDSFIENAAPPASAKTYRPPMPAPPVPEPKRQQLSAVSAQ